MTGWTTEEVQREQHRGVVLTIILTGYLLVLIDVSTYITCPRQQLQPDWAPPKDQRQLRRLTNAPEPGLPHAVEERRSDATS